jgi:hypothetical protein
MGTARIFSKGESKNIYVTCIYNFSYNFKIMLYNLSLTFCIFPSFFFSLFLFLSFGVRGRVDDYLLHSGTNVHVSIHIHHTHVVSQHNVTTLQIFAVPLSSAIDFLWVAMGTF